MQTSDTVLGSVAEVSLTMENGKTIKFSVADELSVPDEDDERIDLALKLPGRLSFWRYQLARQQRVVSRFKHDYDQQAGIADLTYRKAFEESGDGTFTEAQVRSAVNIDHEVSSARKKVYDAEKKRDILKAIADGLAHLNYIITKVIREDADMLNS